MDNDNGGKAEAIVFTEYTVAQVAGIANESNTGTNAYVPNTYYFTELSKAGNPREDVKAENVVTTATLAVGELVTYVQHAGDTYVTVAPATTGAFTQINYQKVEDNTDISYVIGGTTYVKAADIETVYVQDYYQGDDSVLTTTNASKKVDLVVYTDPYGYMLYVGLAPVAFDYVYVWSNNDTDTITDTTETKLVGTDGVVSVENITSVDNRTVFGWNRIDRTIYEQYGSALVDANAGTYTGDYTTGQVKLNNASMTTTSIVVDLRGMTSSTTSVPVYTGRGEVPSMVGATIEYVTDANGFVTVAYIVSGNALDNKDFVVYHTSFNSFSGRFILFFLFNGKRSLSLYPHKETTNLPINGFCHRKRIHRGSQQGR